MAAPSPLEKWQKRVRNESVAIAHELTRPPREVVEFPSLTRPSFPALVTATLAPQYQDAAQGFLEDLDALQRNGGKATVEVLVELELEYPIKAPRIRLRYPRVLQPNNLVDLGGNIRLELLLGKAWTPTSTIWELLRAIPPVLVVESVRFQSVPPIVPYSSSESDSALRGFYSQLIGTDYSDDVAIAGNVLLPPSSLTRIVALPAVEFPLLFELSDAGRGHVTHVGVREFSSAEGTIALPHWVRQNLSVDPNASVSVRLVHLPKGTSVVLQPTNEEDFDRIPLVEQKMRLEHALKAHSALTAGDTIEVSLGLETLRFLVVDTQPEPAICIRDTDLVLELLRTSHPRPSEVLGSSEPTRLGSTSSAGADLALPLGNCSNCGKSVPLDSLPLHFAFCSRNNVRCPKCATVVSKSSLAAHDVEWHASIVCPCGVAVEKAALGEHKQTACPLRLKACRFCDLHIVAREMNAHVAYCGTRTEHCPKCRRLLMLRDFKAHFKSNCTWIPVTARNPNPPSQSSPLSNVLEFFGFGQSNSH